MDIFTDSAYVENVLTSPVLPERNYFTAQEIIRRAGDLGSSRGISFTIHKIPAHLDSTSMGYTSIPESVAVDRLAKAAREAPPSSDISFTPHLENQRQQMLHASARLLISISNLLSSSDGPSSDRLTTQDSSDEDPETHHPLA